MKHCPSPDCPYRRRHHRAQEYVDSADTCTDCGAALAVGDAPVPEPSVPTVSASPRLWKRLAVTVAAPLAAFGAGQITMPGLDTSAFRPAGVPPSDTTSVVALGLMPFISASIVIELACLVVPRWRPLRTSGFDGRTSIWRAVLVLALVIAIGQAVGVSLFLHALDPSAHVGLGAHVVTVTTLVAGAFGLLGLARIVDRHGLGDGFSVMLAGALAGSVARRGQTLFASVQRGELAPMQLLLVGGATLVVVVATVRTSRLAAPSSSRPTATFRVPASGAIPITDAATLLALVVSLDRLGLPGLGGVGALFGTLTPAYVAAETVLALALVALFSYLFHLPQRVAALLVRLRGETTSFERERQSATRRLRRATVRSALFVIVLIASGFVAASAAPAGMTLDMVAIAVLTAVALDLVAEWRARRDMDDVVPVWPVHRVYAVDVAVEALEQAEIPVFVRGLHHRILLQFFGPFVPMHLFVPRDRAPDAEEVVREVLGPTQAR